jgi:hypothetical protein
VKAPLAAVISVAVLGIAGTACLGGDDPAVPAGKASSSVLALSDLPSGFTVFDEGQIVRSDVGTGPREDPSRFDRQAGWKARFRRSGSSDTEGPLVIESRVDVFKSSDGAEKDFDAYTTELEALLKDSPAAKELDDPDVGDEAIGMTNVQAALEEVRFYNIVWRQSNVTASLIVQGFEGKLSLDDALALARKQQRRIEAAAG